MDGYVQPQAPGLPASSPTAPPEAARLADLTVDQLVALAQKLWPEQRGAGGVIRSADVSRLMPALAKAQAEMFSPRLNREVSVNSKRDRTSYTFRYSTLDVINDMLRAPLAEHGLAVTHQVVRQGEILTVITRVWHGDQYLGTYLPALQEDPGIQALGGAMSYCQRYNLRLLFNIASEEDNDGNEAAGNDFNARAVGRDSFGEREPSMTEEASLHGAFERMLKLTEAVRLDDTVGACDLLKVWISRGEKLVAARDIESCKGYWGRLLDRTYAAFLRTLGDDFAWSFVAILRARTGLERDAASAEYKEKRQAKVLEIKKKTPQAYNMLLEHIRVWSRKIDDEHAARVAGDEARQALADEVAQVEEVALHPPAAEPNGLLPPSFHMIDETGDVASEAISSPLDFARAYAAHFMRTAPEHREVLADNNSDALAWVSQDGPAADELEMMLSQANRVVPHRTIDEVLDGDAIPDWDTPLRTRAPVEVPVGRGGRPNMMAYVRAIENDLAAVNDAPTMKAWLDVNEPVYMATDFPVGTRTRATTMANARRRVLGVPADAEA
jgi:hypothetical protein